MTCPSCPRRAHTGLTQTGDTRFAQLVEVSEADLATCQGVCLLAWGHLRHAPEAAGTFLDCE